MSAVVSTEQTRILALNIDSVRPFGDQPRTDFNMDRLTDLAASIKEFGQQVAIIVRELPEPEGEIRFEIIDGERRFRACKIAGLRTVRAEVRGAKDSDHQFMQSVVANFGREDHTPVETINAVARVYQMPEYASLPQMRRYDRVGALFARSGTWVQYILSLWALPAPVMALIGGPKERRLSAPIAAMLVPLRDPEEQTRLANEIVDKQMKAPAARVLIRAAREASGVKEGGPRKMHPSESHNSVLGNIVKIRQTAELILDMPVKALRATLETRPATRDTLVQQIEESIRALNDVKQALQGGTKP